MIRRGDGFYFFARNRALECWQSAWLHQLLLASLLEKMRRVATCRVLPDDASVSSGCHTILECRVNIPVVRWWVWGL